MPSFVNPPISVERKSSKLESQHKKKNFCFTDCAFLLPLHKPPLKLEQGPLKCVFSTGR